MNKILLIGLFLSNIFAYDVYGTATKVVDGDTIYFRTSNKNTRCVKLIKCRLLYIDTPESRKNRKAKKDIRSCNITLDEMIKAGKMATNYAKKHIQIGNKYKLDIKGVDRYNRSLCVIHLPNNNYTYNEQIVLDGYAVPFWKYIKNSKIKRKFRILFNEAKAKNNGLWKLKPYVMKCLSTPSKNPKGF